MGFNLMIKRVDATGGDWAWFGCLIIHLYHVLANEPAGGKYLVSVFKMAPLWLLTKIGRT